jgi:hypothetical protein
MQSFRELLILAIFAGQSISYIAAAPFKAQNLIKPKEWYFVENKGQLTSENGVVQTDIKYYGRQGGVFLFCKPEGISFVFTKIAHEPDYISEATGTTAGFLHLNVSDSISAGRRGAFTTNSYKFPKIITCRADLVLLHSNPVSQITATDQQEYYEDF